MYESATTDDDMPGQTTFLATEWISINICVMNTMYAFAECERLGLVSMGKT